MSQHQNPATIVAGSNAAPLLADLITRAGNLGTAEGQGANSRPELAMEVAKAAADGFIQPNYPADKSNDVHKIWEAFGDARQAAKYDGGKDKGNVNDNSFKAQVSKLNAIAKCGALALKAQPVDGFDTLCRARDILKTGVETKLSAYDALVLVARKQVESGEVALSDDELKDIISPAQKEEETPDERELRILSAQIKSLESLLKGNDDFGPRPSPELDAALENMRARAAHLSFVTKRAKMQVELDRAEAEMARTQAVRTAIQTRGITGTDEAGASAQLH